MPSSVDLASQVARELRLAGLPQWNPDQSPGAGGFGIDETGDAVAPVIVVWVSSKELIESASDVLETDFTHPIIHHLGQIRMAMAGAMLDILESAGLQVRMSADDLSPGVVEILCE